MYMCTNKIVVMIKYFLNSICLHYRQRGEWGGAVVSGIFLDTLFSMCRRENSLRTEVPRPCGRFIFFLELL